LRKATKLRFIARHPGRILIVRAAVGCHGATKGTRDPPMTLMCSGWLASMTLYAYREKKSKEEKILHVTIHSCGGRTEPPICHCERSEAISLI
jgi:hypothetical protein